MDLQVHLSFTLNEEDDILNTTIRDSYTGSVVYAIETPKHASGTLTTMVKKRNQIDGTVGFVFWMLWRGKGSLEHVGLVLNFRTFEEVPAGELLENARGSTT